MNYNLKKDVTLVCVDGSDSEASLKALNFSNRNILFENVKLISTSRPVSDLGMVEYHEIPGMTWNGYNDFVCNKLNDYIETNFCITIQTDGFITNPHLWNDDFFKYDYIGAPWPDEDVWLNLQYQKTRESYIENEKKSRVGNGGFSFRSKKFLEESSKYSSCMGYGEDAFLCIMNYKNLLESGILFPDVETALKFSIENPVKEMGYCWPNLDAGFNSSLAFGFHGKYIADYERKIKEMREYEKK